MEHPKKHVIIVGGGISGLTCALRLQQLGFNVTVLEAANRLGGVIQTSTTKSGYLAEEGPVAFVESDEILRLVDELGLEDQTVAADLTRPSYVYHGRRLHPLPLSAGSVLTTELLGYGSRLRVLREYWGGVAPGDQEESVADFVTRRFGAEVLEKIVGPLVSLYHTGDPARISASAALPEYVRGEREHGSVLKGLLQSIQDKSAAGRRRRLCSFWNGLHTLPCRIAEKLGKDNIELGVRFKKIAPIVQEGKGKFSVRLVIGGEEREATADAMAFAAGAYRTAELVEPFAAKLAEELLAIEHPPLTIATLAYHRGDLAQTPDGIGILIARGEDVRILGCLWTSSLFPGRAPEDMVLMTVPLGGACDTEIELLCDDEILEILKRDLRLVLGIIIAPEVVAIHRYDRAIPQYTVGHVQRVGSIEAEARKIPGLFLAGNYLRGFSPGDCVRTAEETASVVGRYLEQTP